MYRVASHDPSAFFSGTHPVSRRSPKHTPNRVLPAHELPRRRVRLHRDRYARIRDVRQGPGSAALDTGTAGDVPESRPEDNHQEPAPVHPRGNLSSQMGNLARRGARAGHRILNPVGSCDGRRRLLFLRVSLRAESIRETRRDRDAGADRTIETLPRRSLSRGHNLRVADWHFGRRDSRQSGRQHCGPMVEALVSKPDLSRGRIQLDPVGRDGRNKRMAYRWAAARVSWLRGISHRDRDRRTARACSRELRSAKFGAHCKADEVPSQFGVGDRDC